MQIWSIKAPGCFCGLFSVLVFLEIFFPTEIFGKTDAEQWRRGCEADFGHFYRRKKTNKSFLDMIPTKMLVYRGPDEDTNTQKVSNTRRRKKSTGELFQKGYRVRMGHGQAIDKEDQDSLCYSLGACYHVISYWGKTFRMWERGESLPKAPCRPVQSSLGAVGQLDQVQNLHCIMLSIWQTLTWQSITQFPSFKKYIFILFSLAEWVPVMALICEIWHSHKSTPAGEFLIPINARGCRFSLIAVSRLRWLFIVFFSKKFYESFRF